MDLKASTEVKLAPRRAWAEITDFDGFEKLLRDGGGEVARSAEPDPPGLGTRWQAAYDYSGKRREVAAEVVALEPEMRLCLALQGEGLEGRADIHLAQIAAQRCRVDLALHLEARSLRARLFLQPLRLAHGTLEARLAARLGTLARAMEARQAKRRARSGRGGSAV